MSRVPTDLQPKTALESSSPSRREADLFFDQAHGSSTSEVTVPLEPISDAVTKLDSVSETLDCRKTHAARRDTTALLDNPTQFAGYKAHPESVSQQTHSRFDPMTGRWTIFAAGRGERPCDYVNHPPAENEAIICPFCAGNEDMTPPAVLQWNDADLNSTLDEATSPDGKVVAETLQNGRRPWSIRVIPNKFPAVSTAGEYLHEAVPNYATANRDEHLNTLFRSRPITGGHEVFIESSSHADSLVTLDLAQATMLFHAYQLRMRNWREVPTIRYLSLFKNSGSSAGATLHHSHSQLIATSEMPMASKAAAERMKLHWAKTGCCLQCDTTRAELKFKDRIVANTKSLVAYCPYGSHLPMLLRISTKRHLDCFEYLTMGELEELARLVRSSIRWLQAIYPDVSFNYLIQTRPPGVIGEEMSHWSFEIFPRITQVAGFEWSSDCMINPMLPEVAAAKYREIARGENPFR